MSKGIRRPVMKTPFEAKHVIVAGCAAIAMVLGTMSVGASFIRSGDTSGAGEVSAIINSDTPNQQHKPAKAADFSRKHTMEVRDLLQQQNSPLYTTNKPSKNSRKSISPVFSNISPFFLGPINQLPLPNATPSGSADDSDKDAISSETDPSKSADDETPIADEEPAATSPSDTGGGGTGTEEPAENNDAPSPLMRSQTVEQTPTE